MTCKIKTVFNERDIEVSTSTVMVVEVGDLRFEMDERFPWINVFIRDNSDLGYSYFDEIEEDTIVTHEDLGVVAMNYYFKNVNVITEKEMKKNVQECQVQE